MALNVLMCHWEITDMLLYYFHIQIVKCGYQWMMWILDINVVCVWLQEGMKILNRFGYKQQTDQFLIMAENFRPENCFVIQVCVWQMFLCLLWWSAAEGILFFVCALYICPFVHVWSIIMYEKFVSTIPGKLLVGFHQMYKLGSVGDRWTC